MSWDGVILWGKEKINIYLVFVPVFDKELLKLLDSSEKYNQGIFCYVNDEILGKHLRMGTGCLKNNHMIRGLTLSVLAPTSSYPTPTLGEGRRAGGWIGQQWPLI